MLNIPAVVIIDFQEVDSLNVNTLKVFPNTIAGIKAARALFFEWVQEAAGDEFIDNDALADAWKEGRYDTGMGAIVRLNAK